MLKQFLSNSWLFGGNAPFIEELYEQYLANPGAVSGEWREYFDAMQVLPGGGNGKDVAHASVVQSFVQRAKSGRLGAQTPAGAAADDRLQVAALLLVTSYRITGARWATLDPLKRLPRNPAPELEPAYYDLSEADLDREVNAGSFVGLDRTTLRNLVQALQDTYCRDIGFEFMFISDRAQRLWIQERIEPLRATPKLTPEQQKRLLQKLTEAEQLERYLHTKYVGQKRFSLEGGESLIPAIDELIGLAGAKGVQEIVIGMAHRGRLNVLVNVLGKLPRDLFLEFEGKHAHDLPSGDVKYHNGFSSDISTPGGPVHVSLAFNPSHLEIVNPVVEGSVRARQRRRDDKDGDQVLPILVHGDAAFAGQGVVMETLNLSGTRGYGTGGTVHLIVNNQIGFTTSDPRDTRSTIYCTDVAKMVEAPIFHVNGDDPEAVLYVTRLALEFRQQFHKDVVIDIVCFRKLGHNEQDEPSVTQPLMYKKIAQHPGTRKLYADRLVAQNVVQAGEPDELIKSFRAALDAGRHMATPVISNFKSRFAVDWAPFAGAKWTENADTRVPRAELQRLGERLTTVPPEFKVHPGVARVIENRRQMLEGKIAVDWGMAETLAYATLLANGFDVRLSGQDTGRGTFAHRHAVLHDQDRERWDQGTYIPLQHIGRDAGSFVVIDSVLSEEAVLGFEYGFSSAEPNALVVWEAQFGDFGNGAQVVIDQFICSGEQKWGRICGLVMLLPHGYEGQGPEHSSARLERFMQMCAEYNIQVCVPSNAAQIFHLLRRQMLRPLRKPLVVMSPKSLLRHKDASSPLADLAQGSFQPLIGEVERIAADKVKRIIVCSGKVYYELAAKRRELKRKDVVILRLEQLYPFPHRRFAEAIARYEKAKEVIWCQEEPGNQGAWHRIQHYLLRHLRPDQVLSYALRPSSSSPAVGYLALHVEQQKALLAAAFRARIPDDERLHPARES
ncbi:MAG: 2-oxoglutarate dehydrogenase E1 component [Betaproteobacteria bacterium RIFCSPLOWO2_02_FULL_66_14]|nr:MAG: 2-oxoglutarate dehydrogenase E1 component [Betaproteobacteria bacterium RIFCSPLOWO2_02_FULL_66_14]